MAQGLPRLAWQCSLFLAAITAAATALAAGAALDTAGFETYTLGALDPISQPGTPQLGQQGWVGVDQNSGTTNVQSAVVQSAVVQSGGKALKVTRAANVDNRWAVIFGNSPDPAVLALTLPENRITLPSHRFVLVDWDMNVTWTEQVDVLGPFFGVEAYDSIVDPPHSSSLLGSLGVDATTGEVLYQQQDTGYVAATGSEVAFGAWNHFGMVFDFTLHEYAMYVNGTRILKTGMVDRSYSGLNQITDADISAIAAYENPQSLAIGGTAYFDNFRILDGVPGDFDFDGDVDTQDLGLWKTAYHTTAVGDADGDGDSDGGDFMIWQQNLGTDVTPAVAVAAAAPEPSAAALITLGTLAIAGVRRRCASL